MRPFVDYIAVGIVMLVGIFFLWFFSGITGQLNGASWATFSECGYPMKTGLQTNPFAVVSGDYYYDCFDDVTSRENGTITIKSVKVKTIHVVKTLW